MATDFEPTHRITFTDSRGRRSASTVMLVDGAAYTRGEWRSGTAADWERVGGRWLFQGEATPGGANGAVTVKALAGRGGRKRNDAAPRDPTPVASSWRSGRSGLDYRVLRVAGGFRPEVFWAGAYRAIRPSGASSLDRLARTPAEALALSRVDAVARGEAFDAAFLRDVRAKHNAARR